MVNRNFRQEAFDKHDERGKKVAKYFLEYFGYEVEENDNIDKYDIDLIAKRHDQDDVYVEVEHSDRWNNKLKPKGCSGDDFPFPTVHVPARKRRYFEQRDRSVFVAVDHPCKRILIIGRRDLLNSPIIKEWVEGKLEDFIDVPVQNVQIWRTNKTF